ncbi:SCO4225 family membrane protein [Actinokineospora guangxiensis]|uniref:SCO4225 family membrane protein n=1 Tax=Actinokineospora guangxiensis TaxID=1490288 RepID=A0ABW0ENH2_9PSEU
MTLPARVAAIYFAVVSVAIIAVAVLHGVHDGPDASLAPVWAIAAALPGSLAVLAFPEIGPLASFAVLVLIALVQAGLLYLLVRAVAGARQRR